MHSLFFHNPLSHTNTVRNTPHTDADIYENEHAFWLELAVPGFDKDDFTISASEHQLVLKAERERIIPEAFSRFRKAHWLPNGSERSDSSSPSMQNLSKHL